MSKFCSNKHLFGASRSENATEPQKERKAHWFDLLSWILEAMLIAAALTCLYIRTEHYYLFPLPQGICILIVIYVCKIVRFRDCNAGKYLRHAMDHPTAAERVRKIRQVAPTLTVEGKCYRSVKKGLNGEAAIITASASSQFFYDHVADYSGELPNFEDFRIVKLRLCTVVHFSDECTKRCWNSEEGCFLEECQYEDLRHFRKRSAIISGFEERTTTVNHADA